MAATAVAALPCLLLLLLLLLLLPGAARGNEGGAAGSCQCRRVQAPPPFPEKLQSCDTCGSLTRFTFPNRRVCGLKEDPWVTEFKNSHCGKGRPGEGAERADASRGHHPPAPTSPRTEPAPTSPSPASVSPDVSQETPWAAESHTDAAWAPTTTGSSPEPNAEAAAREADNEAPVEEREVAPSPAPDAETPSITVVVVCVALAAGAAALVYGWRRQQCRPGRAGRGPQVPPRGEEEGALCLPGENT